MTILTEFSETERKKEVWLRKRKRKKAGCERKTSDSPRQAWPTRPRLIRRALCWQIVDCCEQASKHVIADSAHDPDERRAWRPRHIAPPHTPPPTRARHRTVTRSPLTAPQPFHSSANMAAAVASLIGLSGASSTVYFEDDFTKGMDK